MLHSADRASVESRMWSRRRILASGIGGFISAALIGFELVDHGIRPGKQTLDELAGACSVPIPALTFAPAGPTRSGTFYSAARNRTVGYTIAYPPGHEPGSALPLVVSLHGFGGNHLSGLGGLTLSRALAGRTNGTALAPMALVSVDGGGLYWNPHPGDDPMAMIVSELIPMCQRLGLGQPPHRIGAIGISMGGYGALLLAEKHPELITAVASISPAVWTTYAQAHATNPGAFASATDSPTMTSSPIPQHWLGSRYGSPPEPTTHSTQGLSHSPGLSRGPQWSTSVRDATTTRSSRASSTRRWTSLAAIS
jgi:pimeloyl-ACP methyl ester carboxylesterase